MARYRAAVCRQCRREGIKLFLKGARCFTEKCAIERRNYPPGQHGLARTKLTHYGIQLREKQKAKHIYGVLENQFRRYFERAEREKGITGENLLKLLERRLDNVVFRLGMAASRREARQMVGHGHFQVNGRKVSVPSYIVKVGRGGPAPAHVEDAGAGGRQPRRGPVGGSALAGGRYQRRRRARCVASRARGHPDPRAGAADRRAVLEVGRKETENMARIPFQKPKHIEWEINTDRYGRLVAEPFEKGYALTVGNSPAAHTPQHHPGGGGVVGAHRRRQGRRGEDPGRAEETTDVLLNLRSSP